MLATKFRRLIATMIACVLLAVIAGCMPPGPRALLDGKKLLEKGRYAEAIEKLTLATSLMKTNAQAWNYLGLARHRSGDPVRAAKAYQQALLLDRELFEARFNLGCLYLEQGKPDVAKTEFTACTLRRPNSLDAWLQLGASQFRLNELTAAEDSFRHALRLSANSAEAFNGLGLVNLQRRRPNDAAQYFALALKQQPTYRPALLNLAAVAQNQLNDPATALQKYREYLALQPREADWPAVKALADSLQQQLTPAPAPRVAAQPAPPPVTNSPPRAAPVVVTTQSVATVKTTAPATVAKPPPAQPPQQIVASPPEVVHLPPEPVIKAARALVSDDSPPPAQSPSAATTTEVATNESLKIASAPPKTEKRSFLSRLNPFRRESKLTKPANNSLVVENPQQFETPVQPADATQAPARYQYLSPARPASGNRAEAERAFAQGVKAQDANRSAEAAQAFNRALDLDGSYFDARYNLGIVQFKLQNYQAALATWEYAIATKPESTEARYNFALTLKAAGFPLDSARELGKVLSETPNDARAHLVLGNLYAEELHSPAKARTHYQRVLEIDPKNPQANAIRYWMVANPP